MSSHAITTPRPRLLVLRALGLGDLLTAVPALRALARAFPSHYRVLAMPLQLAPLVAKIGAIDEVLDAQPLATLDPVVNNAEVAVNLHGCGPQSHEVLLQSNPHRIIAFENPGIPQLRNMPQWNPAEHETQRWCRLLRESGVDADADDLDLRVNPDSRYRGAIVLHPGAANESRRWPAERWIELGSILKSQGHRIVLTGSENEFRRARMIAKAVHLPVDWVIAGKTRIDELADIVAAARAVVCGDTG
ncbi:MAG: glycosyltransferase family 9 protein, partial [Candidatus Eremiobacteraeota bacterium]|nr:glycosyltransferase family 9 protein [Candidatus Eremiobacteraeota bacterium]